MKIPIENKIQPRIPQGKTQIQKPRTDRSQSRAIPNYETGCKYHLNREKKLLIQNGTGESMDAECTVDGVNFGHEQMGRECPLVGIEDVEETVAKDKFRE